MAIEIVRYGPAWWGRLRDLIDEHWQRNHPILAPGLFAWQYAGFGPSADGRPWVFLCVDGERLLGFIGAIPGLFSLNTADGPRRRPGRYVAMWLLRPELRASGLGVHLLRQVQEGQAATAVLGANALAASLFRRMGYGQVPSLTRWVAPLGAGYATLLAGPTDPGPVGEWIRAVPEAPPASEPPFEPSRLADAWERSVSGEGVPRPNGLCRTEEFYAWRYGRSPGFRYRVLGAGAGLAVVRVEEPARAGLPKVLRVIELLPGVPGSVAGRATDEVLLPAVLAWARDAGCAAADFQVNGAWLAPTLSAAGMRPRDTARPETCLAELLRPYRPDAAPINVLFRAEPCEGEWLFLKSDGDMDRPNEPYVPGPEDA